MEAGGSVVGRAAHHVHGVAVAVVALSWEVFACMAVHAARVLEDDEHLLEELGGVCRGWLRRGQAFPGWQREQAYRE